MASVQNIEKVKAFLRQKLSEIRKDLRPSVAVGYKAAYALYVHENIEMKWKGEPRKGKHGKGFYWDPQGKAQAKFLEAPARYMATELKNIVRLALKQGMTLAQALFSAGLELQAESQTLVPVDTGNLKASAFTELEIGQ